MDCRCDWILEEMPGFGWNFSSMMFEDCDNPVGCLLVAVSYVLLLAAFVYIVYRGFRTRSPGMPLIGVAALMGPGVLVLAHAPPFERWLDLSQTVDLFPVDVADRPGVWAAWWVHVVILAILLLQHVLYGKELVATPLFRKYFHAITIALIFVVLISQWYFVVYYRDYYVNEIYPLSTLVMAAGYYGALVARSVRLAWVNLLTGTLKPVAGAPLRGLSVWGAWGLAVGTALLYVGTIIGGPEQAYTDHEETGYCLVYWIYGLTIVLLFLYAGLITHKRRVLKGQPDRPSL